MYFYVTLSSILFFLLSQQYCILVLLQVPSTVVSHGSCLSGVRHEVGEGVTEEQLGLTPHPQFIQYLLDCISIHWNLLVCCKGHVSALHVDCILSA